MHSCSYLAPALLSLACFCSCGGQLYDPDDGGTGLRGDADTAVRTDTRSDTRADVVAINPDIGNGAIPSCVGAPAACTTSTNTNDPMTLLTTIVAQCVTPSALCGTTVWVDVDVNGCITKVMDSEGYLTKAQATCLAQRAASKVWLCVANSSFGLQWDC